MEVKLDIKKYISALNNLIGMDYGYYIGDPDVDAIVEIIMLAKKLDERVKEMENALEKQIPKKPIKANRIVRKDGLMFLDDDNEYWKCPTCTLYDVPLRKNQKYCHYCGQALHWRDEK